MSFSFRNQKWLRVRVVAYLVISPTLLNLEGDLILELDEKGKPF